MRRSLLSMLVVAAGLVVPATASASFIVYRCGDNLCRVNPDGSGQSQLTSDGSSSDPYSSPSLSRDGAHLAFVKSGHLYTSAASAQNAVSIAGSAEEAHMAPDGSRVMMVAASGYGPSQIVSFNLDGTGQTDDWYPTISGGYGASGTEEIGNTSAAGGGNFQTNSLCLVTNTPPGNSCVRVVAQTSNAADYLYLPTLSPNGSTLAVEQASGSLSGPTTIETYNYATGSPIANLTNGTTDRSPAFSPDGMWIAFQRGSAIYKVPAPGGTPQLIVASGEQPTWGGPIDTSTGGGGGTTTSNTACQVPKLKGKSLKAAKKALKSGHCGLGKVKGPKSGKVKHQSKKPGTTLPAGTKVSITLAF